MFATLRSWLGPGGRKGFVYVADEDEGPMREAREGALIRNATRGPPWIVVDGEPSSIILSKWPGVLWRVEIIDAATVKDQEARGGPPLPHARYTRAVAVKIIKREDLAVLFGNEGAAVLGVIEAASQLDRARAEALSSCRDPDAPSAHERIWRAWMRERGMPDDVEPDPWDGTVYPQGTSSSPVNEGLSVVQRTVFERAVELEGDGAVQSDEDDHWLTAPWDGAASALMDAALAFGAPRLMNDGDRDIMLRAWSQTYG